LGLSSCAVDIYVDIGVAAGVGSWEGDKGRWGAAAATGDCDLSTFWVELRVVGLMKSEKLVSDEVVARWEGAWNGHCPFQGIHDLSGSPGSVAHGSTDKTDLVDFEPNLAITNKAVAA